MSKSFIGLVMGTVC